MLNHPLLGLHGIVFRTPERLEVGPIHHTIRRRERILLRCEAESMYDTLLDVLSGKLLPIQGRLVDHERVVMQTDRHVRSMLHRNRTIRELNASGHMPESIWIGGRRRSLFGMMDKIGISTHAFHRPLKMLSEAVQDKYWALRFLASEADLLVGRDVFALEDPQVREIIAMRWNDLRAAVIYAGPPEHIPVPPDTIIELHADGSATVQQINAPIDEHPSDGADRGASRNSAEAGGPAPSAPDAERNAKS